MMKVTLNMHTRQPSGGGGQPVAKGLLQQAATYRAHGPLDTRKASINSSSGSGNAGGAVGVADELGRGVRVFSW